MGVKVGTELFARHRPGVDGLKCNVAGGPRSTVVINRFELADQISWVKNGKDDLTTVSSIERDLDPPAEQDEHGIAVATLNDDRGTASESPWARSVEQICSVQIGQPVEEAAGNRLCGTRRRHALSLSPCECAR